jgi:uncharacterized protein YpmB
MAHLEVKPRSRSNWWLWVMVVIIIIVLAAFYYFNNYSRGPITVARTDTTKTVKDTTKVAVDSVEKSK